MGLIGVKVIFYHETSCKDQEEEKVGFFIVFASHL